MKKKISIIAPMYNEQDVATIYVSAVLDALKDISNTYRFELVLVDDGSKDNTLSIIHDLHNTMPNLITVVELTRNFGLEGAVKAGLHVASGDAVIVMDADLQDPPSLIPKMIELWERDYDVVIGKRKSREHDSLFKRKSANLYYYMQECMSGKLKLEKNAANYRLLSRKAVDALNSLPEVNSVFRVEVPYIGMKSAIIEYARDQRYAGHSKYKLNSMVRYALDGITSISNKPLHYLIYMPFLSFLIMAIFFITAIFSSSNRMFFAGMGILSFFFVCMFAVLVVLGEYIGQIMTEVKHRPTSLIYHIEKHIEKE